MTAERILLVHNYYQQPGGEDMVFRAEENMLLVNGHQVVKYTDSNSRLDGMKGFRAASNMIWSNDSYLKIKRLIKATHPDVAHFHNTFIIISPAAYHACREEGVPVVQTLHNYRLLCPAATFYRDSHVCVECLGKWFALPGIYHACYRGSIFQTAGVSTMLSIHKLLGTWKNLIDVYIALTHFSKRKFVEGGLPDSKIIVKPNFIAPDPGFGIVNGRYALFAGRLFADKGIKVLFDAWKVLTPFIPLKIIGDGPLRDDILQFINGYPLKKVEYLGAVIHDQALSLMRDARFLVFPSEWYEGFPMVIAEAFAVGLPVIASRLGSMEEIIRDGETGLLFNPGDPVDFATKVEWLWNHPDESARMGSNARKEYEEKYTLERNYSQLMGIYDQAIAGRK